MEKVRQFILEYGEEYLLLDGWIPTLMLGQIKEEMVIYNIAPNNYQSILELFQKVTGKSISTTTLIPTLSHGQKLILTSIIALNSGADKIAFRNFFTSLHEEKRRCIRELIEKSGKVVKIIDE